MDRKNSVIQIGDYICAYNTVDFCYRVFPKKDISSNQGKCIYSKKMNINTEKYLKAFIAQLENASEMFLMNVDWMISSVCNMRCPYCFANCTGDITDLKIAKKNADILNSMNLLHITLSGGEPTLNPYLEDIIQLLNEEIAITIDTNGINLDQYERLLSTLKARKCNLRITIDSISDHTLQSIRPSKNGTAYFSKIDEAISFFMVNDIPIMIHTVVSKKI